MNMGIVHRPFKQVPMLGYRLKRKDGGSNVDWGCENIKLLEKCIIEEGLTYRETAERFQVSFTCIYNAARKFDIRSKHTHSHKKPRTLTPKERKLLVELMGIGCSIQDCSKHFGCAYSTLYNMIQRDKSVIRDGREAHKANVEKILTVNKVK